MSTLQDRLAGLPEAPEPSTELAAISAIQPIVPAEFFKAGGSEDILTKMEIEVRKRAAEALQKEVRKPLTDWEDAEKARVKGHEDALDALGVWAAETEMYPGTLTTAIIRQRIEKVEGLTRNWEEFEVRAEGCKAIALRRMRACLAVEEKRTANKKHRFKVEMEAMHALQPILGDRAELAAAVIEAIKDGKIPHIRFDY